MKIFQDLFNLYDEFEDEFSDEKRFPMVVFWNSYLLMIKSLRDYVNSIKTGDWDLHVSASEKCFTGSTLTAFSIKLATFPITGLHSKLSQLSTLVTNRHLPAGINNRNTRTRCDIWSRLTIKTPDRRKWLFNFEHISHLSHLSQIIELIIRYLFKNDI